MISLLILSLVQGLTEFLPVSSSGHLVLAQKFLGFEQHNLMIDVAVHFGTLLSVLTIYRTQIGSLLGNLLKKNHWQSTDSGAPIYQTVLLATVPTAFFGLLFKDFFEGLFSNLYAVLGCLSFTGAVLFFTKFKAESKTAVEVQPHLRFPLHWAFLIGCAQTIAIAPGVSRAGMTIVAGLLLGLRPGQAAYFSFLLAIPAILGSVILTAKDILWDMSTLYDVSIAVGASYIFGLVGLWSVLKVVNRGRLEYFSYYLWTLSALVLLFSVVGG